MSTRGPAGSGTTADMICVLGFVGGRTVSGERIDVGGRRQAQVLARLVAARGSAVSVDDLASALWPADGPRDPVAAIRTFVADIRRRLEPHRVRTEPSAFVLTEGRRYRLSAGARIDAVEFAEAVSTVKSMSWAQRLESLPRALSFLWQGDPFAGCHDVPGVDSEISRLEELHALAIEALADAQITSGRGDLAVPQLRWFVERHPGRQRAWVLLAKALHSSGRTEDGLTVLATARKRLADEFGLDASVELVGAQQELLRDGGDDKPHPWAETAGVLMPRAGRSRVLGAATLLRELAVGNADGLILAQESRAAGTEELGEGEDPRLTADFVTRLEIPGIWTISDDLGRSAQIVAAARRCLVELGDTLSRSQRARLLALIGIESRGTRGAAGAQAADEALTLAREIGDPTVLCTALNAKFLQSFRDLDAIAGRSAIGAELIELGTDHDLPTHQILGHLILLQTCTATGDFVSGDQHAAAVDRLGDYHERSLAGFFTTWYRAIRADLTNASESEVQRRYDTACSLLPTCGMPGVANGLASLVGLVRAIRAGAELESFAEIDFGPNAPWVDPIISHATGDRHRALAALAQAPTPPPDHLATTRWMLLRIGAYRLEDSAIAATADSRIGHLPYPVGAETGMFTFGLTSPEP